MLTPKAQLNLKHAKAYFREHLCVGDYYAEGQQVRGQWFGAGAANLGLRGDVTEREFLRLCEGRHPGTGDRLTARRNSTRTENGQAVANRRVFYDFTFSPPKSVSVVALLQDSRIVDLHAQAVAAAMRELERFAQTRVRRGGRDGERITGNLIGAAFRHETSRASDPHLHTHCIVLNATFDPVEHRWKALQAAAMYRAQTLAKNVYFHELARGLPRVGYATERRGHAFEIKGVPQAVIERFSKRHGEIDAETLRRAARGDLRGNVKDAREQIARDLRKRKADVTTAARLRGQWQTELDRHEHASLRALTARNVSPAPVVLAELVSWAEGHLFERRAVIDESEIAAAALERGRGGDFDLSVLQAEIARRAYLREPDSTRVTSRETLRCELDVVLAARDGRGTQVPCAQDYVPPARLSTEQEKAVRHILGSRDFITLFRGGAGTGKSFALREVARGAAEAGRPVVTVAPQRQQVDDLARDGLPAQTLAQLLVTQSLPRCAVVIVDEAGQIGARQMRDLIRLTRAQGARLILSGDTRQHGAVVASDALRAIEAYGGITAAEIENIRRQDPARGHTVDERAAIARYRAAVKAAAAGDVHTSFGILDRLGYVRELSGPERHAALAADYVDATRRGESALVVAQAWAEVRAVNEAIRSRLVAAGALGRGTVLATFQAVDATMAQRRDPAFYQAGQHAYFVQRYGRFARGELCEIVGATDRGVVLRKNGRHSTLSYRYADRLVIATSRPLELARGDRVQLKFNGRSKEGTTLNNGELVTISTVRRNGELVVEAADGRRKTLSPTQRLFSRGYAVTSYASQGKTVDTVLFADASNRAATNANQWYVTISRGRKRVIVFTPDKSALRADVERAGTRPLALDLALSGTPARRQTPAWVQRVRRVVVTLQRIRFLQRHRAQTHQPSLSHHL